VIRTESRAFTRAAFAGFVTVAFGLPVLLLITTTWPAWVVALADIIAVSSLVALYCTGFQAGYRDRDELAYQHAIEAVQYARFDTPGDRNA
jgi:protein-S-isoprenylcysteine O-methyltransferase Ste14